MIAIRQIKEVEPGAIIIDLPANFHTKRVEIIILPFEESNGGGKSLQDLLLDAPTLTDNELQEFERVRQELA